MGLYVNEKENPHKRYLLKDGTEVPSVTTVLGMLHDEYLMDWANGIGKRRIDYKAFMQRAANVGTATHECIEAFIRGEKTNPITHPLVLSEPEIRSMVINTYNGFKNWQRNKTLVPVHMELSMVSEIYEFGGTLDYFGYIGDTLTLLDFKTSNHLGYKYLLQLAAYDLLLEENKIEKPKAYAILRMAKGDIEFEYVEIPQHLIKIGRDAFKTLLDSFYQWQIIKTEWRNFTNGAKFNGAS